MKTFLKLLFAPLLWLVNACSPLGDPVDEEKSDNHYFNNKKTDIRYSPMGNWFELGNSPMNADVESFEVLNETFAKDKDQIYYEAYALGKEAVDFASFYVKDNDYMSRVGLDKNHVYTFAMEYEAAATTVKTFVIEDANPKTYTHTDWDWGHDDTHHFRRFKKIPVDYGTFENINESFSKDKDSVYVHYRSIFKTLTSADVNSFETLDHLYFAMDDEKVFFLHYTSEEETEIFTIERKEEPVTLLEDFYIKIGNKIHYGATPLELDPKSIEIYSGSYIKDKNSVYYRDQLLEDVDAASFGPLNDFQIGDKNGPFRAGERIKENSNP